MDVASLLPPEVASAAKAIGLIGADGSLNPGWFTDPLPSLQGMLTNATQRASFLDLLDGVTPAEPVTGAPDGEQWHPLLGPQPAGNVYLTVKNSPAGVIFGVGALYQGSGPPPAGAISFSLPLVNASGSGATFIAGTENGPLTLSLRIQLGWAPPAHTIGLQAMRVAASFAPAASGVPTDTLSVALEGLDLDGSGPHDVALDPNQLGTQTVKLIVGLLREELAEQAGTATGSAAAVAAHLVPLLGLDGTLPAFPLTELTSTPLAAQGWIRSLLSGASPPIIQWLTHLAGLIGVSAAPVTGSGTPADPWAATLTAPTSTTAAAITLSRGTAADGATPVLLMGFTLSPAHTAAPPARLEAAATLLAFPLSGTAPPAVLPAASVILRAPGNPAGQLVPAAPGAAFSAGSLQAGISWDGSRLAPLLALINVTIQGASYERIDLTNTGSVAATAASAVLATVNAALGATGPGAHLAALAGLIPPAADPAAPLADPAQLVTNPSKAIAAVHRQALISSTHPWSNLFTELAALAGATGPATGTGTLADPWRAAITTAGPLTLDLAAWNAQTSGNPADPQQLRLGLRLSGSNGGAEGWWCSELLGFDLPAAAAGTTAALGGHHALLSLTPAGPGTVVPGVTVSADKLTATLSTQTGLPPSIQATITNLAVGSAAGTVSIAQLDFPFPAGFDVTNPAATLGITPAELQNVAKALLTGQLASSFGVTGLALSILAGCDPAAPGLQADFPVLGDPAGPGSLFTDPVSGFIAWLAQAAAGTSADGSDFLPALLSWAQALLAGTLPPDVYSAPDATQLAGSGTYQDPWQLPLANPGSPAAALAWLEPAGPPNPAGPVADAIDAASDAASLIGALASAGPCLPAFPAGMQPATAIAGLQSLAAHMTTTDGVVPATSQTPTGGTWTTGIPITAAHPFQPCDPSAISQILAQVTAWAAGGPYAVLLLGPAFSDHTIWAQLLQAAGATDTSSCFNLRIPGTDPASIDLRTVTAAANYYTADLQDDGSGDTAALTAQIGLLVHRIAQLRAGIPVILAAHSTAGIAALSYTTANPAKVKGLITLGTPFAGAPLTPLLDLPTADTLRLCRHLLPAGVAAGPVNDALDHLLAALDGYLAPAAPGALPTPWPYPVGAFTAAASTDTAGTPALALGGALSADLLGQLRAAAAATVRAFTAEAPTHLAVGAQVTCPTGPDGDVTAAVTIRLDAGRLPLQPGAAEPARPARAITFQAALTRPNGWLTGGPVNYAGAGAPPIEVRVRSAELGLRLSPDTSAGVQATPLVSLHEAAFHGPTADLASWEQPGPPAAAEQLLGAIFQAVAAPAPAATSSLGGALAILQALGIVTAGPDDAPGVAEDALNALSADPLGYLSGKARAVLSAPGIAGLTPAGDGSYQVNLPGIPLQLFIEPAPWTIGLRVAPGAAAIQLGDGVSLSFSLALPMAALTPVWNLSITAGTTSLSYATTGGLTVQLPAALPLRLLPPPAGPALTAALDSALPRLLISAAASALLDTLLPPVYQVSGLVSFLTDPGGWLASNASLGDGTVLDPAKITQLLALIPLPGGVTLTAAGTDPTTITLATAAPIGGVLSISVGASIDAARHLTPAGSITMQLALSGTWPTLGIAFAAGPAGIILSLSPGGSPPIQLLPTFSGLGSLAGAAEALLPAALDAYINNAGPTPATRGPLMQLALTAAETLDLYDETGRFSAHTAQLAALLNTDWASTVPAQARTAFVTAAAAVFNDPTSPMAGTLPGTVAASGTGLTWTLPLPAELGSGNVSIETGWDASGPSLTFTAAGVALPSGALTLGVAAGYSSGVLTMHGTAGLRLDTSLGITAIPQLTLDATSAGLAVSFLPLGPGTDQVLAIRLLPSPAVTASGDAPAQIAGTWVIPMAADVLINATAALFGTALWLLGPTVGTLLTGSGLVSAGPGPQQYRIASPIPPVTSLLEGLLSALNAREIKVPGTDLILGFVKDTNGLGARLTGNIDLPGGDVQVSVLFGGTTGWNGPDAGVTLYLISGSPAVFSPRLQAAGLGIGLAGAGDAPLLNKAGFRLGGADGYLFFTLGAHADASFGAGIDLTQLGLPLGQLSSASASNPVAASLFDATPGSGDGAPVNPGVDVTAYVHNSGLVVTFRGNTEIVLPVHASYGPFYLDQIELAFLSSAPDGGAVVLGVDGSVSVSGLDVSVQELGLQIPLRYLLSPGQWSLDLAGLAVSFTEGPVQIAGGLRKNTGPPVEYDGMLSVSVPDFGFTIVGAYSRPTDTQGDTYTSVFMFVSLPIVLGGPPFAIIIGLGGGFGYNRELKPPSDLNDIDSYPLVAAIDDDSLANDPMGALMCMSASIPPRRGSFWLGAGLRFTTFVLINTDAVLYVALDRGFDIALIGVSRMAMPTEDLAIASVELAIMVRYSSAEGLLSAQAQLTDNSYLFSHDCQLTGGFAWFMWFPQAQFVLTLGGYHPAFTKPPQFPDVPRLGFNWSVPGIVTLKGGAYFALTNSCVMAGGSLEASATIGPVSAWFTAYLDILISWDPFSYSFDVGVEIGISVSMQVCFFSCVNIDVTLSKGASLSICGPPFHGSVTVDAYVTTITIPFGDNPASATYIQNWDVFAGTYLTAGDPDGAAINMRMPKGLLPPDPPGAQPQPGTQAQPWQLATEFTLVTETRMPAATAALTNFGMTPAAPGFPVNQIDLAAMDVLAVTSCHKVTICSLDSGGPQPAELSQDNITVGISEGHFPEATWHWTDPNQLQAAARTISAVAGTTIDAHVGYCDPSDLIPIGQLVDDPPQAAALPLPFPASTIISIAQYYGNTADHLASGVAAAASSMTLTGAAELLSGNGTFAALRTTAGLPPAGLPPIAASSLLYGRSAPPLLTPITTGLSMKPVSLPAPAKITAIPLVSAVPLTAPRLKAVLQTRPQPVTDAPPAVRTSISPKAARDAPRMTPPAPPAIAGARLILVPAANAPRPTRAALDGHATRNADLGAATGPAQQALLARAAADLLGAGVTIGAGAAHLWEVPDSNSTITLSGDGIARIICADRSGRILTDTETATTTPLPQQLAPGTEALLVLCLGTLPPGVASPPTGFAAVSAVTAPPGQPAAVGWQSTSTLLQLGPTRLIGRGSTITLAQPHTTRRGGQQASIGVATAADAVPGQPGSETRLPASITVVMICLDRSGADASSGDLAVGAQGATLITPPVRVTGGQHRILLYDLEPAEPSGASVTITVASLAGWQVTGVVGLHGRAAEWATAMQGGIPEHFVPDGPIRPSGSITLTYTSGAAR